MAKKPSLSSTPLWPHQVKAIDSIRKYLSAAQNQPDLGSALVHMPTGTGKTGVIACASHFLSSVGAVLVLSPRIALRDQLAQEVAGRFFTKLGLNSSVPKTVHNIKDQFPTKSTLVLSKTIFVTTIQMLHSMVRHNDANYRLLRDNVDLVIVDEGHYEPAISWREAIRGIPAPKVLFTATPFRNDLKLFDVNFDHAFSYAFNDAVNDKTIRAVKVHSRSNRPTPSGFVSDVVQFYNSQFPNAHTNANPPRVIIRCDSDATIRQIGGELEAAGKSFVLIHENFSDNDSTRPRERRTVPNPQTESAVFWVHQFKLLEGIDDPRFQAIALFEELATTRSLVQQIGRVLRNPSRKSNSVGHFLDHSSGRQVEMWNEFLAFDAVLKRDGIRVADFGGKIVKVIKEAQPDMVYMDGRFRSRLTLDTIDPADELHLLQTVNVLRKPPGLSLAAIHKQILTDFAQLDRDVRQYTVDAKTAVFLYLDFRNSPLLRSKCFIECRLGATLIREAGEYLCVSDSLGGVPTAVSDWCEIVDARELRKLFPKGNDTYLTTVSLHNAQLGPRAVRSRSITASRIDETLPTFDDHSFICTTVKGHSRSNGISTRRYVGFGRGKITDSSLGRVGFNEYIAWLDDITAVLTSKSKPSTSFARFATHAGPPADATPEHLLLDVREIEGEFLSGASSASAAGQRLLLEDSCCEVSSGTFSVTANSKSYAGSITFSAKTQRYEIDIPDLDADFTTSDPELKHGIVRYLNRTQSFRVIPATVGTFYTLGAFYTPIMQFGNKYNDDQIGLLKVLHPFTCLASIGSEKGATCLLNGDGWDAQSLFSVVDMLGVGQGMEGEFGNPDIVVCDDLGTEAADFILGYTTEKRVVFVHCKGRGNKTGHGEYSASGLQEVCGQATKNLRYFSRFGAETPPQARDWHTKPWKGAKGVSGQVNRRVRKGNAGWSGTDVWRQLQSIIRDP